MADTCSFCGGDELECGSVHNYQSPECKDRQIAALESRCEKLEGMLQDRTWYEDCHSVDRCTECHERKPNHLPDCELANF